MHFAYQGFTHKGDTRHFLFASIDKDNPHSAFSIEIELALLTKVRVSVQEGPMFCLQLLSRASQNGPDSLLAFEHYKVVEDDFRLLLSERKVKADEKASRKAPRRPVQRPVTPPGRSSLLGSSQSGPSLFAPLKGSL